MKKLSLIIAMFVLIGYSIPSFAVVMSDYTGAWSTCSAQYSGEAPDRDPEAGTLGTEPVEETATESADELE